MENSGTPSSELGAAVRRLWRWIKSRTMNTLARVRSISGRPDGETEHES